MLTFSVFQLNFLTAGNVLYLKDRQIQLCSFQLCATSIQLQRTLHYCLFYHQVVSWEEILLLPGQWKSWRKYVIQTETCHQWSRRSMSWIIQMIFYYLVSGLHQLHQRSDGKMYGVTVWEEVQCPFHKSVIDVNMYPEWKVTICCFTFQGKMSRRIWCSTFQEKVIRRTWCFTFQEST